MEQKLNGKTALITGGTSGIGLQTARRFVREGAHVFIVGRRQSELDKVAKELGGNVTAIQGDISKLQDLDKVMNSITQSGRKLDILFANAGGGSFAPLGSISEAQFDKEFGINVKGTVFTVQKALPVLKDGSSIILAGSTAALQGMPAFSIYAATKAAIRSLARGWSTDLKDRKIRVNTIMPGLVPTEGYQTELGLTPEQIQQFAEQTSSQIPLGRPGTTDEIAKAVTFLASDDSSYVTGIELVVDGGMTQIYKEKYMFNTIESVNPFASPALATRQEKIQAKSQNEKFILELYAIAEKQDAKAFADLFAEDGHFWDVSAGINYYGKETGKVLDIYAAAFPDMHRELFSMWSVGDTVFVELSLNGTQSGALGFPMGDLPATNKKMSTPCMDVFRIENGKVVSFHCYTAATQLLGQLGVLGNLGESLRPRKG